MDFLEFTRIQCVSNIDIEEYLCTRQGYCMSDPDILLELISAIVTNNGGMSWLTLGGGTETHPCDVEERVALINIEELIGDNRRQYLVNDCNQPDCGALVHRGLDITDPIRVTSWVQSKPKLPVGKITMKFVRVGSSLLFWTSNLQHNMSVLGEWKGFKSSIGLCGGGFLNRCYSLLGQCNTLFRTAIDCCATSQVRSGATDRKEKGKQ